ncbi:U3 snoRNP protein, partial [Cladochytrium tenue]
LFDKSNPDTEDTVESSLDTIPASVSATLQAFLAILGNVKTPEKLYRSHDLHSTCLDLLTSGEGKIQRMALTVLLSWKEPGPSAYAEQLLGLTDDRKFRDFLSTLDIEEISMTVKQEHMPALMGMLIRIFYGKIISKHGRNAGKAGLAPRRNAIFAYMVGLGDAERLLMVSLMTRTFDSILPSETITTDNLVGVAEAFEDIPVRQQMGFLMVLESVVKQFKNHLVPLLPRILTVLIPILMSAYKNIDKADEVLEENTEEEVEGLPKLKQQRHLRQQAVRRLTEILESCQQFDYSPFIEPIFTAFLRARLAKLANENNQAPTSILHLLGIWANSRQYARWLVHDANLVSQLFNILSVNGVKDVVVSHILGMIESLMALDELDESTAFADEILAPSTSFLIKNLHTLLGRLVSSKSLYVKTNGRSISDRSIRILARVSRFVSPDMTETLEELGSVLLPFLKKPARQVSERLKMDILEILKFFLPSFASMKSEPLDSAYYSACSNLFKTLQDPACRIKAVEFYEAFLSFDPRVAIVAEQLRDMNSRSTKRLDEPDYERCFNAMDRIRGQLLETLDIKQWLPVVANLLHLLHEQQEFSVRTAAQNGLKKLIEHASKTTENRGDKDLVSMVFNFILPSIKEGIRATQEVVRQEYVALLAAVVELFPSRPEVSDMVILLVDGDDEASFFTNVYHLQNHRRTRALRRLAEVCRAKKISTGNISNIMLPLISHNLFETERRVSNQMLIDTIGCMAAFASCLPWGRYYDLLRTYFRLLVKRPHMQKEIIRLIVAVLDDFHFDLLDAVSLPETELEDKPSSGVSEPPAGKATDQMDVEDPMDVELDDDDTEQDKTAEVELADKKAQRDRIHTVVVKRILPNLFKHLTHKEDEVISVRAPVAIAIVRLLKKLPMDTLTLMLPKLLTTMCQNLRSRMTEVRTSTRSALLEVAAELGPYYFHFVLKELQGALTRGYQLHILGFTVHALLVEISPKFAADSLDPCSELLVEILIGDIFGDVGAEKEVEALAVKMIETRASKSFDSFEILARFTRVQDLERMLQPLKDIMLETNDAAVARKISDVLRRISVGLFHGTREVDVP